MRSAVAAVLLCAAAAHAAEVVVLPAGPLPSGSERALAVYLVDGERLVAPARVAVRAARGQVVEAPAKAADGGWRFRYRAPAVEAPLADTLRVEAGAVHAEVPLPIEPAGRTRITVEVTPSPLVLGPRARERETATVLLHVRDAAGRPTAAPLRLGASVGRVGVPTETAPGEYRAVYEAPETRFPQVAILAATSEDGGYAAVALPLAARVTVEGQAEPGGRITINVEGRAFGPQAVGPDGRFAVPVVVPPGGRAFGVSVDALGNERRREIDLALPAFPRTLLAVVPPVLRADGRARAEVVLAAVDARGQPLRGAPPRLTVDAGALSPPVARGPGLFTATLTAPSGMGRGALRVAAGAASATVGLAPGPPAKVAIAPPAEPLGAGLDLPQPVLVTVADAAGAAIAGAELHATLAGGRVAGIDDLGEGRYRVQVVAPADAGRGRATLRVEVAAAPPGPPRRVSLHLLPSAARGELRAEAWVDDDLGRAVPGVEVAFAVDGQPAANARTDRYGTAALAVPLRARRVRLAASVAALGAARATLDVLALADGPRVGPVEEAAPPPPAPTAERDLPLKPALPVDLRISAEPRAVRPGGVARVRIQLAGAPSGKLLAQASAGRLEPLPSAAGGPVEYRFVAPPGAAPGSRVLVSVTDPVTGVTVFTEVEVK